jgi:hypothetical protein
MVMGGLLNQGGGKTMAWTMTYFMAHAVACGLFGIDSKAWLT